MRRMIAYTLKALIVVVGAACFFGFYFIPEDNPAWAPEMMALELAQQRALGWQPCEPVISQLPEDMAQEGVVAEAAATPLYTTCEVRFGVGHGITAADLHWVAWHEACHLSTLNEIYADPTHESFEDAAHKHPLFLACLDQGPAERGGY